jgi:hypothetical protein
MLAVLLAANDRPPLDHDQRVCAVAVADRSAENEDTLFETRK